MNKEEYHKEPTIVYKDSCMECGMPVNVYEELMLCDICAEAKLEEEDTYV